MHAFTLGHEPQRFYVRLHVGVMAATAIAASLMTMTVAAQPMAHEHPMTAMEHGQANTPLGISATRDASGTTSFLWSC